MAQPSVFGSPHCCSDMDLENVAFLPEHNHHHHHNHHFVNSEPVSSDSFTTTSPPSITPSETKVNSSGSQSNLVDKQQVRPHKGSKHFETDTSNLSSSGSVSSASPVMPVSGEAVWSNQTSSSTSIESPPQTGSNAVGSNRVGLTGSGQTQHPTNQYHANPHHNTQHHFATTHHTTSFPLPSRTEQSTSVSGRRRNRSWRRWFVSCLTGSESSDRPIACADRVIYRPTASDEDQVTTAIPNRTPNSRILGLRCSRSGHGCFVRLAKLLLLVFVVAAVLESIHHFHDDSCCPGRRHSWLSSLLHPIQSLFELSPARPNSSLTHHQTTSSHLHHSNESPTSDTQLYLDTNNQTYPWHDIRLPSFIHPNTYDLYMAPSMVTFYNRGNVSIEFELSTGPLEHSTDFLVLHSKKLNITNVQLTRIELRQGQKLSTSMTVLGVQECIRLEQIYIRLADNLTTGYRYRVHLDFERQLADELEGFYISSYYNTELKRKQYLLTTHFEPTLARTAFPCFDEPAMKATFRLSVLHDPAFDVYFNTDIIRTEEVRGPSGTKEFRRLSVSDTTVPMSTYLVAFVVCDFAVSSGRSAEGVNIRTIVPVDQDQHTRYALDFASRVLTFYRNFFKVAYPLAKLDMVAVPDFGAGAMENWGIITFRTTTLLYNDRESSAEMQEQVAIVIAHEIAHQWFGNLVTMNWWSELWLNEGFASYVENLGVDYIHPEWRMLDQFVISTSQQALVIDSLLSSHPIHTTVTNPSEIEAIFDMISYKKGSCLIRMIETFLGKEKLQLGLEKYLNRYQFRTAKTTQLWESMSEVSSDLPVDVSTVMNTWIVQQGYPVINARWTGPDHKRITISQHRFVSSLGPEEFAAMKQNNSELAQLWIVPVTVVSHHKERSSGNRSQQLYWLNDTSMDIDWHDSYQQWFKLNDQQSGFYRVNYEVSIWRVMIDQLVHTSATDHVLSPADRAGLLDDALTLMRIGQLDVNTAMDLTRYLEFSEQDYVPWETIVNHFGSMDSLMLQHPLLHRYMLRLIRSLVTRLGWVERSSDDMFEKKLRAILFQSAVYYGDSASTKTARDYFARWMTGSAPIPANIRDIIYNAGIQLGSDTEWNYCWNKYMNVTDASEKRLLLGALGATRNHFLLSTYLSASLNKSLVRTQDTPFVIQNVARNPIGRSMAWNFVKANWATIISTFGQGSFSLDAIISETTWHFFSEFEYQDVRGFFDSVKSVGSGKQAVRQSLEKIRANIYWKTHIESKVIRWLSQSVTGGQL